MVPIGAIHDKSDRESDLRVIPKIHKDKNSLFHGTVKYLLRDHANMEKNGKKQHYPFWNDSGILNNPGIVPKQRLTDTQIETLPK